MDSLATRAGSFLLLVIGLALATTPTVAKKYWISEIEGASMAPTIWGERIAFPCVRCGTGMRVDRKLTEEQPVVRCEHCGALQIAPKKASKIPADRVLMGPAPETGLIEPRRLVVIEHPEFGLTIKRVRSVTEGAYFVTGDNVDFSLDSRDPRFGVVTRRQIRGVVVKILPAIAASKAKAK